jgi:hypothetical protein
MLKPNSGPQLQADKPAPLVCTKELWKEDVLPRRM